MGQITKRSLKGGRSTYTAQFRRKRGGKTIFSLARTFDRKADAEAWLKRKEQELSKPDGFALAISQKKAKTLGEVIRVYI